MRSGQCKNCQFFKRKDELDEVPYFAQILHGYNYWCLNPENSITACLPVKSVAFCKLANNKKGGTNVR